MLLALDAAKALRPPERLTVSEWADRYRVLTPKASAEPGKWRTARTPYLREVMDSLTTGNGVCQVVFCAGAQVGKTEAGNNFLGYVMDHAPAPTLLLYPTDEIARVNVRIRIDPLIASTPTLRVAQKGSKEGGNSAELKDFPGGFLAIRGANAPGNTRSTPIKNFVGDEVSAMKPTSEGDAIALGQRRTATFGVARKEYLVSTPLVEGTCRITSLLEGTDWRKYYVPCPHCDEYQTIEWAHIKWNKRDLTVTPYLVCEHNGCVIEEHHKTEMLARGEWRATRECHDQTIRGYHLSALYSPLGWFSWRQARDAFIEAKAKRSPELMQAFVNTVLAETWKEQGEAPPWSLLHARRGPLKQTQVPDECLVLTCAVDVQRDRLEYEVKAWGPNGRAHSVEYDRVPGDPHDLKGPWAQIDRLLGRVWEHPSGARLQLSKLVVDARDGELTQTVYAWTRTHSPALVMAIMGSATQQATISPVKAVDIEVHGRRVQGGAQLQTLNVDTLKKELYAHLRRGKNPDEPDPVHWHTWPQEYDENYFQGLTAEVLITAKNGKTFWEKQFARNEPLDLAVYNRAAAIMLRLDAWTPERWGQARVELLDHVREPVQNLATPRVKRVQSSYWR